MQAWQPQHTNRSLLADITTISDEEIAEHRGIAALELMQKHIRDRDLMSIADKLGRQLRRVTIQKSK